MALSSVAPSASAAAKKPNIIVIFSDDVGPWNVSAYHRGMMGGRTPNIDRIASEGALFTDYYAQQSCTAGRSAFITGQHPFRTGLLRAGFPAAKQGIQDKDATIAELLKPYGYATSQIGKNHLGDRNEYLPTVHGFDEFFGYLYHLNAMEEPEDPDYPKNPQFRARFGPRNIVDSVASDKDDPTEDPRFGRVGKQVIKDGGPLTRKRMETVDEEFTARSLAFIEKSAKAGKPFFLWHSSTRLHFKTHLSPKWEGKTGYGLAADGMAELDDSVGEILKKLDELKIADNTIVVFTSDNGPEIFTWPDGGNTPFKGEKGMTTGRRLPRAVRRPLARRHQARHHHQRHHVARGLAADLPGRRRRPRREDEAAHGPEGRRQDLQGPSRRLQLPAVLQGRSRQRPAPRNLLFRRQREPERAALRRLEDHVPGASKGTCSTASS